MTYGNITLASASNGSEVVSRIKSELVTSGWTASGSTYTSAVSGGPTLKVTIAATTLGTLGSLSVDAGSTESTQTVYIMSGNSTLTSSFIGLEYSISSSHFYIKLTGPNTTTTGYFNATYGSPTTYILLTTYTPYFTTDNSGAATTRRWALVSSIGNSSPSSASITVPPTAQKAIFMPAPDTGTIGNTAELLTIRPAIQDIAAVGDLIPGKTYGAGDVYWPFIIDHPTLGIVGRLNNVFFGGDNYFSLAGDSSTLIHSRANVLIAGDRYVRSVPAYFQNSAGTVWYTPFGTCYPSPTSSQGIADGQPVLASVAYGGPNIIIKRGSGA